MFELTKLLKFNDTLAACMAMMASALKQRELSEEERGAQGQAWHLVLNGRVPKEWLIPTTQWMLENSKFFPSVSEFYQKAMELKGWQEEEQRMAVAVQTIKAEDAKRERDLQTKYPQDIDQLREIFHRAMSTPPATMAGNRHRGVVDRDAAQRIREYAEERRS